VPPGEIHLGTLATVPNGSITYKIETSGWVCHTVAGLAIYIKKYLEAKEESWKLKYFTIQKNYIFFKKIL
jgi:hypothetical protein